MTDTPDVIPAIICIPDLTGFTKFIIDNNIEFSRNIVPPLLKTLINSNVINLRIAEIEGDAVLFYHVGELPDPEELILQCKKFYTDFGDQLIQLKEVFADDYKKHISSGRLGLKIILHYGEISLTDIGGRIKLFGEDVITAHKLLKNSIPHSEYLLMSEKFVKFYTPEKISSLINWDVLNEGSDTYDHIGGVRYKYVSLEPLYKLIP